MALEKGVYANTAPQQQGIAAKLLKESSDAKIYLAELPLSYEELSNVNKFISQVGDFSLYLSGKISKGQEITDQEMDSFITLGEYAKELNGSLKDLETTLMEGDIPVSYTHLDVYKRQRLSFKKPLTRSAILKPR